MEIPRKTVNDSKSQSHGPALRLNVRMASISLLLFMGLILGSCIEQIDFDTDRRGGFLVVDGRIHDGPGPYTLELSRTTGEGSPTRPVSGAVVSLNDGLGNREFYTETAEGVYQAPGIEVQGRRGGTYHIEIEIGGGIEYRSEPGTIPLYTATDSVYFETTTIEELSEAGILVDVEVVKVYADTEIPDADSTLYLRWDVHELYKYTEYDTPDPFNTPPPYCYVTQYPNPQKITQFSTEESEAGLLRGNELSTTRIDFSFYQRHYFNVVLSSTTKRADEYWRQVDEAVNRSGTIFDVPPATVAGNIYSLNKTQNRVLGFFETAIIDTSRFFTLRSDMPIFIGDPCGSFARNRHYACSNCLELPNSTKEEPDYWLE
ncbi:MAG TPA: DUF4249 family protein [Halalkalibaculum sp.]|nr:DUF4249 family protein [Halalkalibaculum sp.]